MMTPNKASRNSAGMALLTVMFLILAVGSLSAILVSMATTANKSSQTRRRSFMAECLTDAALQMARVRIQEELTVDLGSTQPSLFGTVEVAGTPVDYTLEIHLPEQVITTDAGLRARSTVYVLETQAMVSGARARSRMLLQTRIIPLFQFAAFYDHDLSLGSSDNMKLSGPVHSNGDLYLSAATGGAIALDTNYVRAAGKLLGYRPDVPLADRRGAVHVRRFVEDPFDPSQPREFVSLPTRWQMQSEGIVTTGGMDSDFAGHDANGDGDFDDAGEYLPFEAFALDQTSEPLAYSGTGVTLQTGAMGVSPLSVPDVEVLDMFVENAAGGDYVFDAATSSYLSTTPGTGTHDRGGLHAEAGLSILRRSDGTFVAYDGNGVDVSSGLRDFLTTGAFYDGHQEDDVQLGVIDVAALGASDLFPENGLVYLASYGAGTGADAKGFQLSNGSELPTSLTIASEQAVYVQGDFNTIDKQSAAVIADRVHLLSNDWDGTKTRGGPSPKATPTTYNFAMFSGDTEFSAGHDNGGLQNLMKFHEDWKDVMVTYSGSLNCLFRSRFEPGVWRSGVFRRPNRTFSFDEDFRDLDRMPPFAAQVVEVSSVVRYD